MPVIARPVGSMPEVAGDAALLLDEGESDNVIAELLAIVAGDAQLRAELRERAAARVAAYAPPSRRRARCVRPSSRSRADRGRADAARR